MPLVLVERIVPGVRTAATRSNKLRLISRFFGDRFHNPIAVAQPSQIVLEVARA